MQNDALDTDNTLRGCFSRGACRRDGGVRGDCAQRELQAEGECLVFREPGAFNRPDGWADTCLSECRPTSRVSR